MVGGGRYGGRWLVVGGGRWEVWGEVASGVWWVVGGGWWEVWG